MQDKLRINLEYVRNHSVMGDFRMILKTLFVVIAK